MKCGVNKKKLDNYFPVYSLSLYIFKVTARAVCLLTYLVLTLVLFKERYAFDIPGAIPSSRHARRFLSAYNYTEDITRKNADWFICQGQGLVKACSQFYVRIFYGLSSQNYTTRNREPLTWINVFWLVNQISVDIFWRTSFHIYKTIHNIKLYDALLILMSIILY